MVTAQLQNKQPQPLLPCVVLFVTIVWDFNIAVCMLHSSGRLVLMQPSSPPGVARRRDTRRRGRIGVQAPAADSHQVRRGAEGEATRCANAGVLRTPVQQLRRLLQQLIRRQRWK